ncbi:unnamed protein product [Cladocopium goreaui]|uniref:IQ motif and ankyrin repeat domain-containing protein n=1 Tax=Cladocopium goreaui TaxID=2562237 RepID=A0A9P1DKC1_9DINO|nr:unnamed protein product [Cladocopium goreaui]|mmetsp:Transcript_6717/g.15243  ORF Transcript_6717/g.15243 Transcript_6717/m.15243 type:complete len:336 (-) Transcript_6717:69-1076(-)
MAGSGLFNRVAIPGPFEEKPVVDWGWRDSAEAAEVVKEKVISDHPEVIKAPATPVQEIPRPTPVQPDPKGKFLGNERRVSILSVEVSGARLSACNGVFRFDGLHQQKPLFKADSGAIIYFNRFWKINGVFKTSSWMYSNPESKSSLPPEGEWTLEGSLETTAGSAPTVKLVDEPFRSLGPQGVSLRLQGGRTVLKREENKSWRWIDVPIYAENESAEDGIESLEALCARLEREEAEDSAELNFGLFATSDESPTSSSVAKTNGYYSFDMIRQMGQELMAQTASSSATGPSKEPGPPGPPWPLETPGISLGERLRRSNAESRRGDSGNLLRARLHF